MLHKCKSKVLKSKEKTCPNYILEFRNTHSHLLQVYLGM